MSYDDIPYAMPARVPLTTVAVPKRSLGEKAAKLLFQRYDGKGSANPARFSCPRSWWCARRVREKRRGVPVQIRRVIQSDHRAGSSSLP